MSGAPVKKLPASPRVSSPSVPVANRGGEEVNVGFSDFGAGRSNQLRDPRARRSAGNDREFSLGVTLYEIRRLASRCPSRESLLLVQFSIALKEEIIAL